MQVKLRYNSEFVCDFTMTVFLLAIKDIMKNRLSMQYRRVDFQYRWNFFPVFFLIIRKTVEILKKRLPKLKTRSPVRISTRFIYLY